MGLGERRNQKIEEQTTGAKEREKVLKAGGWHDEG